VSTSGQAKSRSCRHPPPFQAIALCQTESVLLVKRHFREHSGSRAPPRLRVDWGAVSSWYDAWEDRYAEWSPGFTADVPFYVELDRETNGLLVELAVGTGRVAIPVARATGLRDEDATVPQTRTAASSGTPPPAQAEVSAFVVGEGVSGGVLSQRLLLFDPGCVLPMSFESSAGGRGLLVAPASQPDAHGLSFWLASCPVSSRKERPTRTFA
jgi:hypothetical protein